LSEEEKKYYDVNLDPIDREKEKEEKYYKNLRQTRSKVFDLINANVRNNKDYFGNHQRIKFMTLTFGDKVMVNDIEYAYSELTAFMKRLSYHHFKTQNNVIKYLSTFELQTSGRIHFHIVLFNMPYTSNLAKDGFLLNSIWGNGFVGINALKRKNGKNIDIDKIAGYVIKYMTKGTKIENGVVKIDESEENKNIYKYENYKKFGLENVKKFSASKGLKKPIEYKAFIDSEEFKEVLKTFKSEKHFKKVYEKENKKKYEYLKAKSFSVVVNGVHINDIWVANGNLKYESIEKVTTYLQDLERKHSNILKGAFEVLKKKSYNALKWVWNEYDKSRAVLEYNSWLFDYEEN